MCGIAGLMTAGGAPSERAVEAMGEALAHRGPDGRGTHCSHNVAMVHTRLAIIDLVTGDQPLREPGGAALVANGEIYNYVELREALAGEAFATASDCEPPLHLYRRYGLDFADRLRGMYAIAIHDPGERRLVLARDPFGIKPLYYAETEAGFAFASEPQALIAAGLVAPRICSERRAELLQLQFTTGPETAFQGIRRVLPGETLVVADGRIIERRRRDALPAGEVRDEDEAAALRRLDEALEDSVRVHQRSDVPYGMFLSGGIDSSALLAIMARLDDRPVRAFTIGFSGTEVPDERAHARELAREVGAEHVEVEFGEEDFWGLLPEIAAAMDDPAADYAILPTYKLGREAGRDLKVILCGEGGDELFAGYGRYRSFMRPLWMGGRTLRPRGILDRLGVLRDEARAWRDGIHAAEVNAEKPGRTRLQVAQATDCADWLPHDLLIKLDRCLMAHGVEGRTPFLDPVVADAAYRLPDDLKVRRRVGKWLLRRWLADHLPEAKPFARKRGFTVPVGTWIAGRGAELGPLVAAEPGVAEVCRPGSVERLFASQGKRQGLAAWVLLFYALWHRRHILGLRPEGDVFETLAGKG
ncbi:MAG: asparagine synthase (glutamine-hydrolyzing) [Alphaproteobacteria bacterium]